MQNISTCVLVRMRGGGGAWHAYCTLSSELCKAYHQTFGLFSHVCVCVGGGRRVCPLSACKKYTQLVSRDRKEGRPRVCSIANLLLRQTLRGLSGYRYLYHYNSDTIWQGLSRSKTLTQTKFEGFVWLPVYHYNSDKIWQGCPVANLLHRQNLRGLFGYRYITIIQTKSGRVVQWQTSCTDKI